MNRGLEWETDLQNQKPCVLKIWPVVSVEKIKLGERLQVKGPTNIKMKDWNYSSVCSIRILALILLTLFS